MKHMLITIVALVFAGCSEQNKSFPQPLEKFWFQYNGSQETGFRYWERDGDGVWTETYPSGHQSIFKEEGRDSVDGLFGVYAVKLKGDIKKTGTQDGDFRVFIPDYQKKNSFIYLSYKNSGDWTNWRKTDYSINVLTTRDGGKVEDMPEEIKSVLDAKKESLEDIKKLTKEEVADLLSENIGVWSITVTNMITGEVPESFKDTMYTNWSVEGKSTVSKFSPVIDGQKVPLVGYKEYNADEGVFLWRVKGEGRSENISREIYNQNTKIYNGVCVYPDGAIETSEFEILGKDKRVFRSKVKINGKIVFSSEGVLTRSKKSEELKAAGQ
jgi:hypothetical protein